MLGELFSVVAMPVSVEQWRASVGLNNAARARVFSKLSGERVDLLSQLVLLLLSCGVGLTTSGGQSLQVPIFFCISNFQNAHIFGGFRILM